MGRLFLTFKLGRGHGRGTARASAVLEMRRPVLYGPPTKAASVKLAVSIRLKGLSTTGTV